MHQRDERDSARCLCAHLQAPSRRLAGRLYLPWSNESIGVACSLSPVWESRLPDECRPTRSADGFPSRESAADAGIPVPYNSDPIRVSAQLHRAGISSDETITLALNHWDCVRTGRECPVGIHWRPNFPTECHGEI